MRLNRREWWVALFGSVSVLASCATARRSRTFAQTVREVSDLQLTEELALLAGRPYSELGIPMLLFGEDLEGSQNQPQPQKSTGDPSTSLANNRDLRDAFEKLSAAFSRIRPHPVADDVAPLMEWLAERDFGMALASNGRRS